MVWLLCVLAALPGRAWRTPAGVFEYRPLWWVAGERLFEGVKERAPALALRRPAAPANGKAEEVVTVG